MIEPVEEEAASLPATQFPPPARAEFAAFRDLLLEDTGVLLTEHKRELLVARLSRRLRVLNLSRFGDYLQRVMEDQQERDEMIDRMMTNETRFFREPHQFDFLEREVIPRWSGELQSGRRGSPLRVWSAGCSTGQEPVSIALAMLAAFPDGSVDILATDISRHALRQAARGEWPVEKAAEIPEPYLREFMLRGVGENRGIMKITDRVRSVIQLRRLNLHGPLPPIGPFDAIFCRNVLIYFEPEARRRALDRLLSRLAPRGYLFLGHAESLLNSHHQVKTVAPSVYIQESHA